ncbi:MAG: hypothetical protein N2049_06945 [Anaerolineales bacterium]|uniref:Uncharacterized protein n=1 Tax=Thermanaerothrix solaris TaxID=3058434 RepID=A0ABU3NUV0_9CHLR|nr:hypothetical protein [Thermanaerothrix sp. 4228-RoL]MCX7608937.1 hypothetical protein [Anaerolineales bacterium]MDT8899601.1 hypothetical protein [Thermanaerothrix sp. 4228-RoL]
MLPDNDVIAKTVQSIAAESRRTQKPEFAMIGFCDRYLKWLHQTFGARDNDFFVQSLIMALRLANFELLPSPTLTYRKGVNSYALVPDIVVRTGSLETLIFIRKGPATQSQKNDLRLALTNNNSAARQILAFFVDDQSVGWVLICPTLR